MGLNKKSLAKVFGPIVVLTAALALPVESLAAKPAPQAGIHADHGKGRAQANRGNRGQVQRVQRQKQVVRKQVVQKQVRRQAAARPSRQKVVRQQVVRQPVVRQQVVVRQPRQRVVQRQVVRQPVVVQRQVIRQRVVQGQRVPVYDNRYYNNRNRYYDSGYNNQYRRGGADRSVIAADGYLEDTGSCLILRGHQGQVYNLVGDTRGLNDGDHVRLLGQLFYDRDDRCGGQLMELRQVQTLWEDDNHRRTYYDHLRDGSFDNYSDRYGDRYYDDDRY
ncbi:MAG TPA: hypothetical protein VHU81_14280 [Thermoanaerobaculia bacterium]|nr:hypothetical protein [Thermoanaerobaculia bacterium]